MPTTFARVQEILKSALTAWQDKHHRPPDLTVHGNTFGWDTCDQLLQSSAFDLPLIAPDLIGNGKAGQTNLIVALKIGVPGFPRMPKGGPFLSDPEIAEIADWIDGGAKP